MFYVFLCVFLVVLLVLTCVSFYVTKKNTRHSHVQAQQYLKEIKNGNPSYSTVFALLNLIGPTSNAKSAIQLIDSIKIGPAAKEYFKDIISLTQDNSYKNGVDSLRIKYNSKHFKEVLNLIKNS